MSTGPKGEKRPAETEPLSSDGVALLQVVEAPATQKRKPAQIAGFTYRER